MSAMDISFSSRVRDVFGALDAGLAPAWSVSGLAQARSSREGVVVEHRDDIDSEDDEEEEEEEEGEGEEQDGRSRKRKRPVSCDQLKVGVRREEDEQEFEYGKKMIGMDDTLDFEEEEDEFDRVAEGLDRAIGWSNEKDISPFDEATGSGEGFGTKNGGGKRSFSSMAKDGVSAAPSPDGDAGQEENLSTRASKVPRLSSSSLDSAMRNAPGKPQAGKNSERHVRFAVDEEKASSRELGLLRLKDGLPPRDWYSKVPDHVRNPSKYTCYSLDWSDEDEDSTNRAALRDVQLTRAGPQHQAETEPAAELPKSLTFIARAKAAASKPTTPLSDPLDDRKREGSDGGKPSLVQVASHLSEEPGQEQPRLQGEVEESDTMEDLDKGAERDRAARRYRNRVISVATDSSSMDIG